MTQQVDDLLQVARERPLSQEEVSELARQAGESGSTQRVLVQLMTAMTAAGRQNVALFRSVVGSHVPVRRGRQDMLRMKRQSADEARALNCEGTGVQSINLSAHAVERYVDRHGNGEPTEQVMERLRTQASQAVPMKEKTRAGDEQWVSPDGTVFVVRRDGMAFSPTCTTILPSSAVERLRGQREALRFEGKKRRTGRW